MTIDVMQQPVGAVPARDWRERFAQLWRGMPQRDFQLEERLGRLTSAQLDDVGLSGIVGAAQRAQLFDQGLLDAARFDARFLRQRHLSWVFSESS
jgi:hypothetical protein